MGTTELQRDVASLCRFACPKVNQTWDHPMSCCSLSRLRMSTPNLCKANISTCELASRSLWKCFDKAGTSPPSSEPTLLTASSCRRLSANVSPSDPAAFDDGGILGQRHSRQVLIASGWQVISRPEDFLWFLRVHLKRGESCPNFG